MSSPPDALPRELLFSDTDLADAERMNLMTGYIYAQIRSILALKPDYQAAIDQLKAIGLERIAEILTPVLLQGQQDGATLAALVEQWTDENVLEDLRAGIEQDLATSSNALKALLALAAPTNGAAGQMLSSSGDPTKPNVWIEPYTRQQAEAERWFFARGY